VTLVAGVPLIVGETGGGAPACWIGGAVTVMVNGESADVPVPSVTEIVTLRSVPTSVAAGVPDNWPVEVLNDAQVGWFMIENVRVPPLGLDAVGVNE
jgi:hypothetical protein